MKMSCNGCRILRKGCSENCIIRPCLEWIKSPESQANATIFLAKFYGRTGLLNLVTAAPHHLAPVVFRSLLYEACGRLVNPTYGSLGLFWTGEWARCEAAVDAVLAGPKINGNGNGNCNGVAPSDWHILPACDIRHMSKRTNGDHGLKRVTQVIKPNWKSPSVQLVGTSFVGRDGFNPVTQTDLDLELTLGFPCQSTCANKSHY